jgi:tape measure domain-containing protein
MAQEINVIIDKIVIDDSGAVSGAARVESAYERVARASGTVTDGVIAASDAISSMLGNLGSVATAMGRTAVATAELSARLVTADRAWMALDYTMAAAQHGALGLRREIAETVVETTLFGEEAERASRAWGALSRIAAGAGIGLSIGGMLAAAQDYQQAQAVIQRTAGESADIVERAVYRISQASGASFTAMADLTKAMDELPGGTAEALGAIEAVALSMAQMPGAAQSAEAAVTQFTQAMQSGVLRGDEFNSMMEQAPALADALAKGLGVTRGEMRAMAEDGELSAARVSDALRSVLPELRDMSAQIGLTLGQQIQQVENAYTRFSGQVDARAGASPVIGEALGGVTQRLESMQGQNAAVAIMERVATVGGLAADAMFLLADNIGLVVGAWAAWTGLKAVAGMALFQRSLVTGQVAMQGLAGAAMKAGPVIQGTLEATGMSAMRAQRAVVGLQTTLNSGFTRNAGAVGLAATFGVNPLSALLLGVQAVTAGWLLYESRVTDAQEASQAFNRASDATRGTIVAEAASIDDLAKRYTALSEAQREVATTTAINGMADQEKEILQGIDRMKASISGLARAARDDVDAAGFGEAYRELFASFKDMSQSAGTADEATLQLQMRLRDLAKEAEGPAQEQLNALANEVGRFTPEIQQAAREYDKFRAMQAVANGDLERARELWPELADGIRGAGDATEYLTSKDSAIESFLERVSSAEDANPILLEMAERMHAVEIGALAMAAALRFDNGDWGLAELEAFNQALADRWSKGWSNTDRAGSRSGSSGKSDAEKQADRLRDGIASINEELARSTEEEALRLAHANDNEAVLKTELALLDYRNKLTDLGAENAALTAEGYRDQVAALEEQRRVREVLETLSDTREDIAQSREDIRLETQYLGDQTSEYRIQVQLLEQRRRLTAAGATDAEIAAAGLESQVRAMVAEQDYLDAVKKTQDDIEDISRGAANDLAGAFAKGIVEGGSSGLDALGDVFAQWYMDLQRQLLMRPLQMVTDTVVGGMYGGGVQGGMTQGGGGGSSLLSLSSLDSLFSGSNGVVPGTTGYNFATSSMGQGLGLSSTVASGPPLPLYGSGPSSSSLASWAQGGTTVLSPAGTFVGNGLNNLGWGSLGGFGGSMISQGLLGQKPSIGGQLGGMAGGFLGGSLGGGIAALGSFGGPVGAIAGGLLGTIGGDFIGGLFGPGESVGPNWAWTGGPGKATFGADNGADVSDAKNAFSQVYDAVDEFAQMAGLDKATGKLKSSVTWFEDSATATAKVGDKIEEFSSVTEALEWVTQELVARTDDLPDMMRTVAENASSLDRMTAAFQGYAAVMDVMETMDPKPTNDWLQAVETVNDAMDALARGGATKSQMTDFRAEAMSSISGNFDRAVAADMKSLVDPIGSAMDDLSIRAQELRRTARLTGGDMSAVNAYVAQMSRDIRAEGRGFDRDIRQQTLEIKRPWVASLEAISIMEDDLLAEAKKVGGSTKRVHSLIKAEMDQLKEGRASYLKGLDQQIAALQGNEGKAALLEWEIWVDQFRAEAEAAGAMSTASGRQRVETLIDLRKQEIAGIDGTTAALQAMIDKAKSLQDWVNSTILGSDSSLTSEQKFIEAQSQFSEQASLGKRADIAALTGAADALLSASQDYYGGTATAGFGAMEKWVYSSIAQIGKALGQAIDIPAFADGGFHAGGVRLVGELGPEIEATGAARYWSAAKTAEMLAPRMVAPMSFPQMSFGSDMMAPLVREIAGLRQDNATLRDEVKRLRSAVEGAGVATVAAVDRGTAVQGETARATRMMARAG